MELRSTAIPLLPLPSKDPGPITVTSDSAVAATPPPALPFPVHVHRVTLWLLVMSNPFPAGLVTFRPYRNTLFDAITETLPLIFAVDPKYAPRLKFQAFAIVTFSLQVPVTST